MKVGLGVGQPNSHWPDTSHTSGQQQNSTSIAAADNSEGVSQPVVQQPYTNGGQRRWSSNSWDEVPEGRSGGSFAAWAKPSVLAAASGHQSLLPHPPSSFLSGQQQQQPNSCRSHHAGVGFSGAGMAAGYEDAAYDHQSDAAYGMPAYQARSTDGDVGPEIPGPAQAHEASGNSQYVWVNDTYGAHAEDGGVQGDNLDQQIAANGSERDPEDGATVAMGSGSKAPPAEAATTGDNATSGYGWPSDPEAMLTLLQQQRQQYRSWVAQCASTALGALDPLYTYENGSSASRYGGLARDPAASAVASTFPSGAIPGDVPGMVAAMDVAGSAREYLLALKAAAEGVREATRALVAFEALSLPSGSLEQADGVAEAAEAEYVSAAYGVTTAVAAAAAQVAQLTDQAGASTVVALIRKPPSGESLGGGAEAAPEAPLMDKLDKVGAALCRRLRQEAETLMADIRWPPPLADAGATPAAGAPAAGPVAASANSSGLDGGAYAGFEQHPVVARRLVGVLTALTHFQMAVAQRPVFYQLLAGQSSETSNGGASGGEDGVTTKPLLWAAKALADPVAAKLRAHFHPAAPTGRLDRPAWLYSTVIQFIRRHGHSLAALDDMLACLQLKPHYNMPAEFARALQEAVLEQVRDQRIPAILQLRNPWNQDAARAEDGSDGDASGFDDGDTATAAEVEALWLGLMDASAWYDIAMLPLLGATGPRVEADAARAMALLSAAAAAGPGAGSHRRRVCDPLDPTASGTADMHSRYVAVAAVAVALAGAPTEAPCSVAKTASVQHQPAAVVAQPSALLRAWAAAEGVAALRAVEAIVYDDTSLAPAEEAAARALGDLGAFEELADGALPPAASAAPAYRSRQLHGGGGGAPWQRDTWPPVMAREVATVLDGLVARSRWLSARPAAQRDFLEASAGPVLALLRRRLGRLVDTAVTRGDVLAEGLPRVCASLCAAHFIDEHLHSLLVTELAPLVQALDAAPAAASTAGGDDTEVSGCATPTSSATTAGGAMQPGKLGGGGGFWSGLLAAAGGGAGGAVPSSPARAALRDGVTTLTGGIGTAASLASVPAGGGGGSSSTPSARVLGEYVRSFARLHRDGCLKVAREMALGFGRHSVAYRHAIEANPQFPFTPEGEGGGDGGADGDSQAADGSSAPAASITPAFAPTLLFLQTTLERLSRCCDKATFADVWRGAALSINRFMFNFIATESRFTRPGARQFAADVAGLAQLFAPYSRRGGGMGSRGGSFTSAGAATAAGGQHFRELQAAARLLCLGDEEAANVMRRASAAAVAAQAAANAGTPAKARRGGSGRGPGGDPATVASNPSHPRGDPVRSGMAADPVLSSSGLACLSPLQIMNVIEHRA